MRRKFFQITDTERKLKAPHWFDKYIAVGREKVEPGWFPFFSAVFVQNNGAKWQCAGFKI